MTVNRWSVDKEREGTLEGTILGQLLTGLFKTMFYVLLFPVLSLFYLAEGMEWLYERWEGE